MRVLVTVEGTRGDAEPMLILAESLRAAGHGVAFVGPEDVGPAARARDLDFTSTGEDVQAFLQAHAASLHSRGLRFFKSIDAWSERSVAAQFRALNGLVPSFDFVVAGGTSFAASSICERHDIPYRFVLFTPAMLPSASHSPALLPFQSGRPWLNRLSWWLLPRLTRFTLGARIDEHRRALGLSPMRDPLQGLLSPYPILATDDVLAPGPSDSRIAFEQMRCFHPFEPGPLPEKLETFLSSGPPPVFFGFGSMTDPDPGRTTRRLIDAIDALGVRALISRGWAGLGDLPVSDRVHVTEAVPHASLFPRCRAIVHHGGSGTTHTAARSGVPQLIVPHVLDQFYFERRLHALGVAPPGIPRAQLETGRLVETLRALLDNELLAERARELGDRLAELGPTIPDADRVLTLASN